MLCQLSIENIALIDRLTIEFNSGLNILTGETGTGKSIIVDAVNLVLGERADRELIKAGSEYAVVEGIFDIQGNSKVISLLGNIGAIDEEDKDSLVISRKLSVNGKNVCRMNGRLVTLSSLKDISSYLVDIHGQHEHQSLLKSENHIQFLDRFGGSEIQDLLKKLSNTFHQWKATIAKIKQRFGNDQERARRMDMLQFQIEEIKNAKLKSDEEIELQKQRSILLNSEKINQTINRGYDLLYAGSERKKSVLSILGELVTEFQDISQFDESFLALHRRIDEIYYLIEDIALEIRDLRNQYDYDPQMVDQVELRVDTINRLKRKYGKTVQEVLDYLHQAETELQDLVNNQQVIQALEKEKYHYEEQLYNASKDLSMLRKSIASEFSKLILEQLRDLGMSKSQFHVEVLEPDDALGLSESSYTENGFNQVEFLISPNPGEPLKPLAKIVSGGELSRIMLALKNISAEVDDIPCLIFDEIDTGISGRMAQVVAEKLVQISKIHQVICVTHLPQIASMADTHYLIQKLSNDHATKTSVSSLSMEERYSEIARMVGGAGISNFSLDHAKEMVKWAQNYKKAN